MLIVPRCYKRRLLNYKSLGEARAGESAKMWREVPL